MTLEPLCSRRRGHGLCWAKQRGWGGGGGLKNQANTAWPQLTRELEVFYFSEMQESEVTYFTYFFMSVVSIESRSGRQRESLKICLSAIGIFEKIQGEKPATNERASERERERERSATGHRRDSHLIYSGRRKWLCTMKMFVFFKCSRFGLWHYRQISDSLGKHSC